MIDTVMPSQRRRARLVLILIAGIPLSMMLGATALWWAVEQGHVDVLGSVGTANHGELIDPPRSVADVVFQHEGVAETLWQDLPAKWRLLVVQRGERCDAICQQQLYQTRQIHLALGKNFNRVGRVVCLFTTCDDEIYEVASYPIARRSAVIVRHMSSSSRAAS